MDSGCIPVELICIPADSGLIPVDFGLIPVDSSGFWWNPVIPAGMVGGVTSTGRWLCTSEDDDWRAIDLFVEGTTVVMALPESVWEFWVLMTALTGTGTVTEATGG